MSLNRIPLFRRLSENNGQDTSGLILINSPMPHNERSEDSNSNNILDQCKEFRKVSPDILTSNGLLLQDEIDIQYRIYDFDECNVYENFDEFKPEELIHLDCCGHQLFPLQFQKSINSGCKVCPCCGRSSSNYFLLRPFRKNSILSLIQNYSSQYSRVVLATEFFDPNMLYSIIKGSKYSDLCKKDFFFVTTPENFANTDEIIHNYNDDKTILFLHTKNDTPIDYNNRHRIKVVI